INVSSLRSRDSMTWVSSGSTVSEDSTTYEDGRVDVRLVPVEHLYDVTVGQRVEQPEDVDAGREHLRVHPWNLHGLIEGHRRLLVRELRRRSACTDEEDRESKNGHDRAVDTRTLFSNGHHESRLVKGTGCEGDETGG